MKLLAFLKKDLLVTVSYRFAVFLRLFSLLVSLLMLYFIGQTFTGAISPHLERYGGRYFPYVLVGMAVSSFVSVGLNSFARDVRSAQVEGTLEALLSTPTSIYTVLIGNSLWAFLLALASSLLFLAGGALFLQLHIAPLNALVALVVLILTFFAFLTVGMLSASFIMIFKQGNPVGMLFGTSSYFLGGVLFPVEVLPKAFQHAAAFLPITHAIRALRELLLATTEVRAVLPVVLNLVLFSAVLAPVSILVFHYAVKRAKRDGSLIQY